MSTFLPLGARQSILENGQRLIAGKGFSAVGLNEILAAAGVPKGSFYHYFGSKDAYGEALLESYFEDYLADLDESLAQPGTVAERLMNYWRHWQDTQSYLDYQGKCLAVKLGAEVATPGALPLNWTARRWSRPTRGVATLLRGRASADAATSHAVTVVRRLGRTPEGSEEPTRHCPVLSNGLRWQR